MNNLFRFIQLFGWIQGTFLALKFKFDYLDHFKLPGIQHAFALRKNTSDKATFRQVFIDRYYYMNYPATVNTIIDGGANIGLFTLFIKNKFPAAKVICIEPDAENFSMLQKNTSGYENVFYEHAALWNTKNMLQLHNSEQYNKAGITVSENKNPRGEDETIAGITIDGLLEKYNISRIDIMKLDIEAS
ncbi:MAG TPA: FkbM family methyltransferase, partial [Panacibacter sp.]|nr:FkbM family methyltransferase [Panacibacter sp.]